MRWIPPFLAVKAKLVTENPSSVNYGFCSRTLRLVDGDTVLRRVKIDRSPYVFLPFRCCLPAPAVAIVKVRRPQGL